MNHSQEPSDMPTTDTEGSKPQFSIGKMMLWTAIAADEMAIMTAGGILFSDIFHKYSTSACIP